MFFNLRRFFCSCLIFLISVQISAKPLFFEDYELKYEDGEYITIFKEKTKLILRFDLFSEIFELVLLSEEACKNGSSGNKEQCIPISLHHKLNKKRLMGECSNQYIDVSFDDGALFVKDDEGYEFEVNLNSYMNRPVSFSFEEKIKAGEYGTIRSIDKLLHNGDVYLNRSFSLDSNTIIDVKKIWNDFSEKYKANCIERNLKTFLSKIYIGLVSSNMTSENYCQLYQDYNGESSATHKTYESLRKAQDFTNKSISKIKEIEDYADRLAALETLFSTSFSPFYSDDFDEYFSKTLQWDSWYKERQELPNAVIKETIISQDVLNEKIKERIGKSCVLSENSKDKELVKESVLRKAAAEIDLEGERSKVVAIKHIYAYDKELKEALTQAVDGLYTDAMFESESEGEPEPGSKVALFNIINTNPDAALLFGEAFLDSQTLDFIGILAEKIFIEKVLRPALGEDQALVEWMNNPAKYTALIKKMFIGGDHEAFVDKVKEFASQCIEDKELNGSQEAYSVKSIKKLGLEPS